MLKKSVYQSGAEQFPTILVYLLPRRLQRTTQVPYNTVPEDYLMARSFFMALF